MTRRVATLLLLIGALVSAGCSSPLSYYAPTVESVRVVLVDQRPDTLRDRGGIMGLIFPLFPLVPYGTRDVRPVLDRMLADSATGHLARTNAFRQVYGPQDPVGIQKDTELELEVRLLHTSDSRVTTTFGLGLPGAILWFFGLPHDVATARIGLELRWKTKGMQPFLTRGYSRESTLYWLYEDSEGRSQERLEEALGQAIDQAVRRGIGPLRSHLKRDR